MRGGDPRGLWRGRQGSVQAATEAQGGPGKDLSLAGGEVGSHRRGLGENIALALLSPRA